MHQFAGEEHDLVLPRNDGVIASLADINAIFQPRIVKPQFSALELGRLTMKEIHKCQTAGRDRSPSLLAVIWVSISGIGKSSISSWRRICGNDARIRSRTTSC